MSELRLAVTGGIDGQVARALVERGPHFGVKVLVVGPPHLDLLQPASVLPALANAHPDVVISAAAYTAVDLAETHSADAYAINAVGAGEVAHAASELGVAVVHLSTDYVFDGALNRPYREEDVTGPLGEYGRSKLAGERAVVGANENHAILRTAWLYSPFGKNFVRTMLSLAETRDEISVVADRSSA